MASSPYEPVLGSRRMPGAQWFLGACLNYAEHALRHERQDEDALLYLSERVAPRRLFRLNDRGDCFVLGRSDAGLSDRQLAAAVADRAGIHGASCQSGHGIRGQNASGC